MKQENDILWLDVYNKQRRYIGTVCCDGQNPELLPFKGCYDEELTDLVELHQIINGIDYTMAWQYVTIVNDVIYTTIEREVRQNDTNQSLANNSK